MVVGLGKELHATCRSKFLETVEHLRTVAVKLLESGSGDGECHLECSLLLFNLLEKKLIHRKIAFLGYPAEDGTVGEIVVVVRVLTYVEKPVLSQTVGLMDLKIQTN